MDCIEFESKIPKDILEIVCKLGRELHIHPLSSLESENYFYGVLSNFQGKKEELIAYLGSAPQPRQDKQQKHKAKQSESGPQG